MPSNFCFQWCLEKTVEGKTTKCDSQNFKPWKLMEKGCATQTMTMEQEGSVFGKSAPNESFILCWISRFLFYLDLRGFVSFWKVRNSIVWCPSFVLRYWKSERFPGYIWRLYKSTIGLLQLRLATYITPYQNLIQTNCGLVDNFHNCKHEDSKDSWLVQIGG